MRKSEQACSSTNKQLRRTDMPTRCKTLNYSKQKNATLILTLQNEKRAQKHTRKTEAKCLCNKHEKYKRKQQEFAQKRIIREQHRNKPGQSCQRCSISRRIFFANQNCRLF